MCSQMKRRNSFVLIEVLIATSLFVLMLVAIFGIFWRTTKTNESINRLRRANEQMVVAEAKLQSLFSNVTVDQTYRPYFYVESDASLVATIDNPMHTNPAFAGIVIAKLYLEEGALILATFPHITEENALPEIMEKETLLSNVSDFKMEFFLAPSNQSDASEEEATKKPPECSWTDSWLMEYETPPTLVKLTITKKNTGEFTLFFFIPEMVNAILYDRD